MKLAERTARKLTVIKIYEVWVIGHPTLWWASMTAQGLKSRCQAHLPRFSLSEFFIWLPSVRFPQFSHVLLYIVRVFFFSFAENFFCIFSQRQKFLQPILKLCHIIAIILWTKNYIQYNVWFCLLFDLYSFLLPKNAIFLLFSRLFIHKFI